MKGFFNFKFYNNFFSNIERLYHYVLKVSPNPNKFTRSPTIIDVDGIDYIFDGFSVFFHDSLPETFPQSPMNQWNSEFTIKFEKENSPEVNNNLLEI